VERLVHDFIAWQDEQPRSKFQLAIFLQTTHCLKGRCVDGGI
jgi:hypothetical protein